MAINHSDVNVGDKLYSPHHSRLFTVEQKDSENLLLSLIGGNEREPMKLVSSVGGIHYGLQSFSEFKKISRQLDQLNALPKSHWQ